MDDDRLAERHIVVTGGANGIGRGIAIRIAEAGGDVSIFDVDADGASETVDAVEDVGTAATSVAVDITSKRELEAAVERVTDTLGPIDGLINAAGVQFSAPFLELNEENLDRHLAVNVRGTFLTSQVVGDHMAHRERGGAIVNIGSVAGAGFPNRGQSAYAASKGAVDSMTIAMAIELAEYDIRCNVVHPGATKTPMLDRFTDDGDSGKPTIDGESLDTRHLLGRVGEPADIAHLCVLLLSPEGEWITGQDFVVDGGVIYEK